MLFDSMEQRIQQQEEKIRKLSLLLENQDREVQEFLQHQNIHPEKISEFLEKQENFCEAGWSELNQEKQKLDEKLQRDLSNIRNPKKAKKALASLHVERHWLHVR